MMIFKDLKIVTGKLAKVHYVMLDPLRIEDVKIDNEKIIIKTKVKTYEIKRDDIYYAHWDANLRLLNSIFEIK